MVVVSAVLIQSRLKSVVLISATIDTPLQMMLLVLFPQLPSVIKIGQAVAMLITICRCSWLQVPMKVMDRKDVPIVEREMPGL
jgi:hypothetical protein